MGVRAAASMLVFSLMAGSADASWRDRIRQRIDGTATRCESLLTRTFDLGRGTVLTARQLRSGIVVPEGSALQAPPTINTAELAGIFKTLVIDGNQLGFTQLASQLAIAYGGIAYIPLSSGFGEGGAVVVTDPDLVMAVFKESASKNTGEGMVRGADFDILRQFIGHGLLSTDGAVWDHKRKLLMPFLFSKPRLAALVPVMNGVIHSYLDRLDRAAETGEAVDFHELMKQTTLGVITQALFSYPASPEQAATISHSLAVALDFSTRYSIPVTLFKDAQAPITDPVFINAVKAMEKVTYDMIAWRLANPLPGDLTPEPAAQATLNSDVLTYLFRDLGITPGPEMTLADLTERQRRILRDEVMTLMLAGHETTANGITWTWVNLIENQAVLARMRQEISGVLQGRRPTTQDFRQLEYTARVHHESLRHDSPVYWFARHALQDTHVGNYFIPAGTHVFFSSQAVHRHPGHWPDGDRFDPDRFDAGTIHAKYGGNYCPYAGGGHFCAGQVIANAELNLISIAIAQRFELTKAVDAPVVREGKVTLQPQGGFWVKARRR